MKNFERSNIDSDLLRTFQFIARCGSLTAAAGQLNRTQSAISVQLKKLEIGLGVSLFDRTAKGMSLTDAGDKLLPRATSILLEIKEVGQLFADPLMGSIKVGLPDDFEEFVLERVLSEFAFAHPDVNVIATSGCTSGYAAAVGKGSLDIAVCSGPDNGGGETLEIEETVWASKKNARFSNDRPIPLAVLDRACWWRDLPLKFLEDANCAYSIAFRSSSFASVQAAIRSGVAVGVLPASCLREGTGRLAHSHGLPDLPNSRRSILINADAPAALTDAMAEAIREARFAQVADV